MYSLSVLSMNPVRIISKIRGEELAAVKRMQLVGSLNMAIIATMPIIVSVVTLVIFAGLYSVDAHMKS